MPPSPAEPAALVQDLADALKQEGHIRTPRVEMAFRVVPRHIFLPGVPFDQVYRDQSVITKSVDGQPISSSSQPAAMAIMLEQLGLEPGQRVLEIGAGTGYNAALLAQIVGDRGQVISVDLDPDLVAGAREHLAAVGLERVQVVCGDGGLGYPASAPYDRIVLSVGAWDITPAWQEQLAVGGRLLLPLELKGGIQRTVALQRAGDHFASISVSGCSFMMLRGGFAGAAHLVALGAEPGLFLTTDNPSRVDAEATLCLLKGASEDFATWIRVSLAEIWGGLSLWLGLYEPAFCQLTASGLWAEREIIPNLFRYASTTQTCHTIGSLGNDALCILASALSDELVVRTFGRDEALAQQFIANVKAWDAAGRPASDDLLVAVYPLDANLAPARNAIVIPKRWTQLVVGWKR